MLEHTALGPMKANELFSKITDETATSIFRFLRGEQRQVYAATLSSLAANRKLRPVFVQKKPVPQQIAWMVKNVRLRASAEVAENVLQLWLLKGHSEMLIRFLDGVGIEHDGEGAAEELPESLDGEKLEAAVGELLASHDTEVVRIYLHTFQMQRQGGWTEIEELIARKPELQLDPAESPSGDETAAALAKEEAAPEGSGNPEPGPAKLEAKEGTQPEEAPGEKTASKKAATTKKTTAAKKAKKTAKKAAARNEQAAGDSQ